MIEEDESVEHFQQYNIEYHIVYETPYAPVAQPSTLHNEENFTYPDDDVTVVDGLELSEANAKPPPVKKPPQIDPNDDFEFEFPELDEFNYPYEAAVVEYVFKTYGQEKNYKIENDPNGEMDPYGMWETGCFFCGDDNQ